MENHLGIASATQLGLDVTLICRPKAGFYLADMVLLKNLNLNSSQLLPFAFLSIVMFYSPMLPAWYLLMAAPGWWVLAIPLPWGLEPHLPPSSFPCLTSLQVLSLSRHWMLSVARGSCTCIPRSILLLLVPIPAPGLARAKFSCSCLVRCLGIFSCRGIRWLALTEGGWPGFTPNVLDWN